MFLDPRKPLATCNAVDCADCPVHHTLHCHFSATDLVRFFTIAFPAFLVGGAGIYRFGTGWLILWVALFLAYFGFIEIRVMCSHCPHYAEEGGSLRCWANYGSPKLWRYRPGPMSGAEKFVFLSGLILVFGYPTPFLLLRLQWLLLVLYVLTVSGGFMAMQRVMCSHCMNFACPLNRVGEDIRQAFFRKNPRVAEAWGRDIKG